MGFIKAPWLNNKGQSIRVRIRVHWQPWILSPFSKCAGGCLICTEAWVRMLTDWFLHSERRHNKTADQRPRGKPPSCDVEHPCARTLRRRCHNQKLCGAARLAYPPPGTTGHLTDLKKCHEQLVASARRDDNPHLGGHWA